MIGDILPSFQFHPFSLKICLRLPLDKATAILKLLVEGMSIRGIERVTQVHRDTILRLLLFSGERCSALMNMKMRDLHINYLQVDEAWTFVQKKSTENPQRRFT